MTIFEGSGHAKQTVAGLSSTLSRLLIMADRPVLVRNMENFQLATVSPYLAAHPRGFLALFAMAGNALWSDLGEPPYQIRLQDCPESVSGFELISVITAGANLDALILAIMEAISQVTDETGIVLNDLDAWVACAPPAELVGPDLSIVARTDAQQSPRTSQ
jgi:hypothetical protein